MVRPVDVGELREALSRDGPILIQGSGSKADFLVPYPNDDFEVLDMTSIAGIVELEPDDQVVAVRAGTQLSELQAALGERGQCLPLPDPAEFGRSVAGYPGTVGGLVAMRMPHALEAQCGGPRDWVLGLTVALADGTLAKCGGKAVKNVAGYDAHKLMTGARGTLGVIVEAVFRTTPIRSLPSPRLSIRRGDVEGPYWVQRTLRSDFDAAVGGLGEAVFAADPESSTLWAVVSPEQEPARYPGDWAIRSGCGVRNLALGDKLMSRLVEHAKDIFDAARKLNPSAMGAE